VLEILFSVDDGGGALFMAAASASTVMPLFV
jgi:hypothetical protein